MKSGFRARWCIRDPKIFHKMGSDMRALAWVGEKEICVVSSSGSMGNEYPDNGATAEVYTNPDPKKYIELELLGPLSVVKSNAPIWQTQNYSLRRRTGKPPEAEVAWPFR